MAAVRKIPDVHRELIRQQYSAGATIAGMARQYGVTDLTIRRILGDLIAQRRTRIAEILNPEAPVMVLPMSPRPLIKYVPPIVGTTIGES